MTNVTYWAHVHISDDGVFGVSFPDFHGCVTSADSIDDVHPQAIAALNSHIAASKVEGLHVPKPCGLHEAMETSEGAMIIPVEVDHNVTS